MQKQIPILFSTPMVQALLDKRKTQTMRIVKSQPSTVTSEFAHHPLQWPKKPWVARFKYGDRDAYEVTDAYKCPYGKPGDLLWVREKWYAVEREGQGIGNQFIVFDDELDANEAPLRSTNKLYRWGCHPSIHMPKEAARIWLQVTDVRVERLQDITETDAIAEGVQPYCEGVEKCPSQYCQRMGCQSAGEYYHYLRDLDDFPTFSAKESFESLWQSINGSESWQTNPWVWVVSFKVLSTTGKPSLLTESAVNEEQELADKFKALISERTELDFRRGCGVSLDKNEYIGDRQAEIEKEIEQLKNPKQ